MSTTIAAFYKFVRIDDPDALRSELENLAMALGIKGTVLLAREGINGTVAGSAQSIASLLGRMRGDSRLTDLVAKISHAESPPFQRLKVKVKPEIVTFGAANEADPTVHVGTYVAPTDWNALISRDDVVLVDTRNAYEFAVGSFQGAIDPGTRSFTEFKDFVGKKLDPDRDRTVAMFCTGGIRCEKASAYLLSRGFQRVYHLDGGILRYLEEVPAEESLWQGECFVFDERVSVAHGVEVGTFSLCANCGFPLPSRSVDPGGPVAECPSCRHSG